MAHLVPQSRIGLILDNAGFGASVVLTYFEVHPLSDNGAGGRRRCCDYIAARPIRKIDLPNSNMTLASTVSS
ncbi:MAG: hypothetical protein H0X47_18715 [Nitrospirales bacterium]|nr:hypothetical protein [Nitrospirales bacterium]